MRRFSGLAMLAIVVACLTPGCATRSHTTVHTYEYSEDPPPEQGQANESEYKMVSPGQMVDE